MVMDKAEHTAVLTQVVAAARAGVLAAPSGKVPV